MVWWFQEEPNFERPWFDTWIVTIYNFICHVYIITGNQWMQNILDWVIDMVAYFNPNFLDGGILEITALINLIFSALCFFRAGEVIEQYF